MGTEHLTWHLQMLMAPAPSIDEVSTEHLVGSTGCRLKPLLVRKPFPPLEPLGRPLAPHPPTDGGQNRGLCPMLQGVLCLLHGGGSEVVLLLLVHLAQSISGACRQHIQKHGCRGYVLAGPGEGGDLPLCMLDHRCLAYLRH
jgi:hypothetical protein